MSSIILDPVAVSRFRVAEMLIPPFQLHDDPYDDFGGDDDDDDNDEDEGDGHDDDDNDHSPDTLSFSSPTTSTQTSSQATRGAKITSSTTSQTTISPSSPTSLVTSLATPDQTGTQVSQPTSTIASPTIIPALETQASTSNASTKAGIALVSILGILAIASVAYFLFAFLPRRKHRRQQRNLEKGITKLDLDCTPDQDTGIVYGRGARTRRLSFLARKWYSTGSQATQRPAPKSISGHASTDPPVSTPALLSPPRSVRRSIREIGMGIGLGLGRVTPLFKRQTTMALQSRFSGTTATTTDTSVQYSNADVVAGNGGQRENRTARGSRELEHNDSRDERSTMVMGTEEIFGNLWENQYGERNETADRQSQRTSLPTLPLPVFSPTRFET